jgi:hypothetical protein
MSQPYLVNFTDHTEDTYAFDKKEQKCNGNNYSSKSTVTWAGRLARKDFQLSLLESADLPIMTIYLLLPKSISVTQSIVVDSGKDLP